MPLIESPIDSGTQTPVTPTTPLKSFVTDTYTFAFDIDGVLIRGGKPIPAAIEAIKMLNGANEYGVKVPYIFLTNGGGKSEEERCQQLSKQLDINVNPGQFICGHTPMGEMASKYKTVLVVGGEGDKCRRVAESYGFPDVVTPGDIIKDNKETTPFRNLSEEELSHSRARNFGETEIEAIFVFADSRNWAGDLQIIIDLLTSRRGVLGTSAKPAYDQGPPIYFSHSDTLWSAGHQHTRLGLGMLRRIVESTFREVTGGKEVVTHCFGKPQLSTYQFANRLMQRWRATTYGIDAPPGTVYFVGDTPESDIKGTNEFDASDSCPNRWYSILVGTGVWNPDTIPSYEPAAKAADVLEAVRHAMEREHRKHQKMKQGLIDTDAAREALEVASPAISER